MIFFNEPPVIETSSNYLAQALCSGHVCGDGYFTKLCHTWMEERFSSQKVLLTTSGTAALEMAAALLGLKPGDEVILPSFTFSSTANAFVKLGAKLVFVDIRPDTMNIDEAKLEQAISSDTKVIVPVHYAGISCDMDAICEFARTHGLAVVEDAAQGIMSQYKGSALGAIGNFGCFSFHETKNFSMGEGGALLIRDEYFNEAAEILREKGTDRSKFMRGQIDKYSWIDYGSSYLPSDLNAAYLWSQLEIADTINTQRLTLWNTYYEAFTPLSKAGFIEVPHVPADCTHNAHMFYLKCADIEERTRLIAYLNEQDIMAVFHYVPLHSSQAGLRFGRFNGEDEYTTRESERLVRLPLYYGLTTNDQERVVQEVMNFYGC